MIQIFGVSQGHISSIVNGLASFLYTQFQPVLYWNPVRLSLQQLQLYAAAVTATVGVQELGIWGFIDGTVWPIARPLVGQEEYYSEHKGYHGIKLQSIVTPDGLISSLYGPEALKVTGNYGRNLVLRGTYGISFLNYRSFAYMVIQHMHRHTELLAHIVQLHVLG